MQNMTPNPGRIDLQTTCLFFGTFNPIHVGHLLMAETALEQLGLETVLFIPSGVPPHRYGETDLAPAWDRWKMVQLATADNPRFAVWDGEVAHQSPSYTAETLGYLLSHHTAPEDRCPEGAPKTPFNIMLGADALAKLATWHAPERLISWCRILQAPRKGGELVTSVVLSGETLPLNTIPLLMDEIGISSTDIRTRLRQGRSVRYRVPESVRRYLQANRLYR
jgi:nicotinate-nucleotide adenylyltransferase